MARMPNGTVQRNGKQIPNRAAGSGQGARLASVAKVRKLNFYGNPDHIRFVLDFQTQDAKSQEPQAGRYTRTVEAMIKRFGCSDSTARNALAAVKAYRMDVFAAELPGAAAEAVDEFRKLAVAAADAEDYSAAVAARREMGKIMGIYAPLKVDLTATTQGPDLKAQLRTIVAFLPPEDAAHLERILAGVESAVADGRLKLPAGETERNDGANDDAEDAEIVGEQESAQPEEDHGPT